MAFVPVSSLAPVTVTVSGTVAVTQATSPWIVDGSASGAAREATLADALSALNDVALTAILAREKMET